MSLSKGAHASKYTFEIVSKTSATGVTSLAQLTKW